MRTWFRYSPPHRAVRGGLVIQLQLALAKAGHVLTPDSVYANQTRQALKAWQAAGRLPVTGEVDEITWTGLTGQDKPGLFRRCLALTAAFEGHNYTLAVGNFDGAYVTWGIVGFTLRHGNLGKVIRRVNERHPSILIEAMGAAKAQKLLEIIGETSAKQKAWSDSISTGARKYVLQTDWKDAFEALGNRREVREIQDEVAFEVYWKRAAQDLKDHGQMTELDAALFFDTAVQNGGVGADRGKAIRDALTGGPAAPTPHQRLALIAKAIASKAKPEYQADVLSRKGAIAAGSGAVHQAEYQIANWGLEATAIDALDLLRF